MGLSPPIAKALAGIEAGVLGGAIMFGWLALGAVVDGRSIWLAPDVLGSTLAGRPALAQGFGWATISGLGLHFSVSGAVGMVFGLLVGNSGRRFRAALLGMLAGLVWYYFSQALFWRKLGWLVTLYSPPRTLLLAHLAYGLTLGWFPSRLRAAMRGLSGEAPEAQISVTDARPEAVE